MAPGVGPDLEELEAILHAAGLACSAPAAHGVLSGCLVADPSLSGARLERALGECHPRPGHDPEVLRQSVEALRLQVLRALNDTDLGFDPLLPDDSEGLEFRARALGQWVGGFLGGLGQTPRLGGLKPSPEATEILRDFAEIGRIEVEPEVNEDNEQALAELNEYVRVGVMLLADELAPTPPRSPIPLQ
ncbi:UPF0149 family protein [Thioalkalivibrio sp.]|uniref:UPF0149 family protein n=1 Tax=Thioalkalivibrio sp. TaxID=2093813 RepID=UPI0039757DB6